jgi:hypothetical protein
MCQLHYALDAFEVGDPPYNISQLQAMRWAKAAWDEVPQAVITHCWHHTTLLTPGAPNPTSKKFFSIYFNFLFNFLFSY